VDELDFNHDERLYDNQEQQIQHDKGIAILDSNYKFQVYSHDGFKEENTAFNLTLLPIPKGFQTFADFIHKILLFAGVFILAIAIISCGCCGFYIHRKMNGRYSSLATAKDALQGELETLGAIFRQSTQRLFRPSAPSIPMRYTTMPHDGTLSENASLRINEHNLVN
jgi:hypothetical protein